MPRRNENAYRSRYERNARQWGYRDPAHWNHLICTSSTIKTTAESIVRSHREQYAESSRQKAEIIRQRDDSERMKEPFLPTSPSPHHPIAFWCRINWNVVFEWACWGALILCLIYVGFFVYKPFVEKIWK